MYNANNSNPQNITSTYPEILTFPPRMQTVDKQSNNDKSIMTDAEFWEAKRKAREFSTLQGWTKVPEVLSPLIYDQEVKSIDEHSHTPPSVFEQMLKGEIPCTAIYEDNLWLV